MRRRAAEGSAMRSGGPRGGERERGGGFFSRGRENAAAFFSARFSAWAGDVLLRERAAKRREGKTQRKGRRFVRRSPFLFSFFLFICVICDRRSLRCGTAERRIAAAREERGRALRGTRQVCGGGARRLRRFAGISYGGGREIRKVCTAHCGFLYKGKNGGTPGGTGRTRASAGTVRPAELTVFLQSRRKKYIFPCLNFTLVPYTVITETKLDI